MAKSDIEDCCNSPTVIDKQKMVRDLDMSVLDKSNDSTIHSGHFMLSDVHHDTDDEDLTEIKEEKEEEEGYDFITAVQEPAPTYQFGDKCVNSTHSIDSSLTKLFECMTLAYSGKLTSPKWKNFKGIKLLLKDKVRLNNIIWREWHMQYIQGRQPIICQFEPPITDKTHNKAEAVVLEGKYWKRRLESVTTEYKKWRLFCKQRFCRRPEDDRMMEELASHAELLERVGQQDNLRWLPPQPLPTTDQLMEDDFSMDFSDTLFSSLNQPFAFPNPKEISQLGISCADIIQPGLVQLQPSLDDFMDTLEPLPSLQEMLGGRSIGNTFGSSPNLMQNMGLSNVMPTNVNLGDTLPLDLMAGGSQPTTMDIPSTPIQQSYMDSSITTIQQPQTVTQLTPPTPPPPIQPTITSPTQSSLTSSQRTLTQQLPEPRAILQPPQLRLPLQQSLQQQLPPQPQPQPQHQHQQPSQTLSISPVGTALNMDNSLGSLNPDATTQIIRFVLDSSEFQDNSSQQTAASTITLTPSNQALTSVSSGVTTIIHQGGSQLQTLLESLSRTNSQMDVQPQQHAQPQVQTVTMPPLVSTQSIRPTRGVRSSPILAGVLNSVTEPTDVSRRASTGSLGIAGKMFPARKEGDFLVPQPLSPSPRKPRTIAPAPATAPAAGVNAGSGSSIAHKNTFLAQLLTTGSSDRTYPASSTVVKQENSKASFTRQSSSPAAPITPPVTRSQSLPFTKSSTAVTDFQKNVILAAASHAMGTTTSKLSEAFPGGIPSPTSTGAPSPSFPDINSPGSPSFQAASPNSDCGSPGKSFRSSTGKESERQVYREHRRVSHISAEQKRRCNIKVGFDTLHHLVPALAANPNKISKAATLQKTADFCRKLKQERAQMQEEAEILRKEIDSLNNSISVCQSQLPATGVPVTRQRVDQMREMFDEYVKNRTLQNWKFWLFSIIIRSLFDTYNNMVSTSSVDDLCRTVLAWLEQHCSLVSLRPAVLNSLRTLSTTTSILSDPSRVPEQATQAVTQPKNDSNS